MANLTFQQLMDRIGILIRSHETTQFYGKDIRDYAVALGGVPVDGTGFVKDDTNSVLTMLTGGITDFILVTLKRNTQFADFPILMTDATTHKAKTGLAPAVTVSIDGAAAAPATNSPATEVGDGAYKITLAAADLNGTNYVDLAITAAGADSRKIRIELHA